MDYSKVVDKYSYRVIWSAEDQEHVRLCALVLFDAQREHPNLP